VTTKLPGGQRRPMTVTAEQVKWRTGYCILELNELTTLTVDVAQILASHKCALYLNGLTDINDEAAEALAKYSDILHLDGLITLSEKAAVALGSRPCSDVKGQRSLSLASLNTLSPRLASALVTHKGELSLNGLSVLTDEAAKVLSTYNGDALRLYGLVTLSDEAAKALKANPRIHLPRQFHQ
jgi:hypothetical protein